MEIDVWSHCIDVFYQLISQSENMHCSQKTGKKVCSGSKVKKRSGSCITCNFHAVDYLHCSLYGLFACETVVIVNSFSLLVNIVNSFVSVSATET